MKFQTNGNYVYLIQTLRNVNKWVFCILVLFHYASILFVCILILFTYNLIQSQVISNPRNL